MTQAPYVAYGDKVRFGTKLGEDLKLEDMLWNALTDTYTGLPMGITAEKLAEQYGISREDVRKALLSKIKVAPALGRLMTAYWPTLVGPVVRRPCDEPSPGVCRSHSAIS